LVAPGVDLDLLRSLLGSQALLHLLGQLEEHESLPSAERPVDGHTHPPLLLALQPTARISRVSQLCYSDDTMVSMWCHNGVTVVQPWCYSTFRPSATVSGGRTRGSTVG
jgi:hypothetical protein